MFIPKYNTYRITFSVITLIRTFSRLAYRNYLRIFLVSILFYFVEMGDDITIFRLQFRILRHIKHVYIPR